MSVLWTDIRDLPSGEFASLSEAAIAPYIAEASREVAESVYGDRYDDAVKYLAAHLIAVLTAGSRGTAGPVVSESAGPVSRSYAAPATIVSEHFAATVYGRRFLDIRRQVAGGPWVL